MRRLLLLSLICAACSDSTPPSETVHGPVRGLGFDAPIQPGVVAELDRLGHVVAVIQSARVVIMISAVNPDRLAAVAGSPHVGPVIGDSEEMDVEVAVEYDSQATESDLAALRSIGTITYNFPEYQSVFLRVRLDKLELLDGILNAKSVWIGYDPPRPD